MSQEDYYEILMIHRTAGPEEIKQAYKKLALRWHPDKNRSNPIESEKMFKLVAEAYACLSDPEKRQAYDQRGYRDDVPDNSFSRRSGRPFRSSFAHDIFNELFGDFGMPMGMGSMHRDPFFSDPFMNDPFFTRGARGLESYENQRSDHGRGFDPFGFGNNFSSSTSSGVSISFSGSDGDSRTTGRSTTTTTTIDRDGKRRTKTITTIRHPDGRVEKTENESTTDSNNRALPGGSHNSDSHRGGSQIAQESRASSLANRSRRNNNSYL